MPTHRSAVRTPLFQLLFTVSNVVFKLNLLPSSFRNREFWKVALCFGMTMGIADQWSSILDVDVTDLVDSEV